MFDVMIDDGVAEIDHVALAIGQPAVLQDLQQRVPHLRVRLLDLVEQDHPVGPAPHRLGELAAFVVADVAGRRAEHPADGVALLVFAHVDADQRLFVVEQELGQRLRQLGLADAAGAQEDEAADGPLRVLAARCAPRRSASATAVIASSWPTIRRCSSSSMRRSLAVSPSSIVFTGMPVQRATTVAMSDASTTSSRSLACRQALRSASYWLAIFSRSLFTSAAWA